MKEKRKNLEKDELVQLTEEHIENMEEGRMAFARTYALRVTNAVAEGNFRGFKREDGSMRLVVRLFHWWPFLPNVYELEIAIKQVFDVEYMWINRYPFFTVFEIQTVGKDQVEPMRRLLDNHEKVWQEIDRTQRLINYQTTTALMDMYEVEYRESDDQ